MNHNTKYIIGTKLSIIEGDKLVFRIAKFNGQEWVVYIFNPVLQTYNPGSYMGKYKTLRDYTRYAFRGKSRIYDSFEKLLENEIHKFL